MSSNSNKLIGTNPDQVPLNSDLESMAYQNHKHVSITGGEVLADTLGINEDPSASVDTSSTHKVPIVLNGTTYYVLLTDS